MCIKFFIVFLQPGSLYYTFFFEYLYSIHTTSSLFAFHTLFPFKFFPSITTIFPQFNGIPLFSVYWANLLFFFLEKLQNIYIFCLFFCFFLFFGSKNFYLYFIVFLYNFGTHLFRSDSPTTRILGNVWNPWHGSDESILVDATSLTYFFTFGPKA